LGLPPAYGKEQNAGLRSRRAVLLARWLRPALAKGSYWLSLDLAANLLSRRFRWIPKIEVELRSPELKRERPVRSVDLVEGPSSPLLCAPAWRPARLLGYLASPRLGCLLTRLPASGHHWLAGHMALPVCPSCMNWCWCACSGHLLLGAPTQRVKRCTPLALKHWSVTHAHHQQGRHLARRARG
jgi:hypothetical protein